MKRTEIWAIALLAALASEARAQEADRTQHGDWVLECSKAPQPGQPACEIEQVVSHSESGEVALAMRLLHLGAGGVIVHFTVETGVTVAGGALLQVDQQEVTLPGLDFTVCDQRYCALETRVEEAALQPFVRGSRGVFATLDLRGETRSVPLSFSGFTAALNAMKERNAANR